jgi:superfamily II DNA or RNA helicase
MELLPPKALIDVDVASNPHIKNYLSGDADPIELYDYQENAVQAMLNNLCGLLEAPCGSGKTMMGLNMLIRLKKKALWLTHTKDLLDQSKDAALSLGVPKELIGTIEGGKINISEGITFAMVKTLSKVENLYQYKNTWDVIIVDECHHAAGTPTQYTQFSTVINALAAQRKYGLSATIDRADGSIKCVYALLGKKVYTVTKEMVADKTCDITIQQVSTGTPITSDCLDTDGTMIFSKLVTYLGECEERNQTIAENLFNNRTESNLILSDRLAHLKGLIECLKEKGIPEDRIRMIEGSMTSKKAKAARKQAILDMKNGNADFLFASYGLAQEGLNIPRLNRLHLVTPHKYEGVIQQCVGRIGRAFPDKGESICFDYIDAMPYCINAGKSRIRVYKKEGCAIKEVKVQVKPLTQSSFSNFVSS